MKTLIAKYLTTGTGKASFVSGECPNLCQELMTAEIKWLTKNSPFELSRETENKLRETLKSLLANLPKNQVLTITVNPQTQCWGVTFAEFNPRQHIETVAV